MSLRERKKAETLDAIKAAGWALFSERGFEATTVRALCKRAGVATGTLFNYVEDKRDLLALLFAERILPVQVRAFETLPPGDLVDQACHVFGAFLDFYDQDPGLSRTLIRNILFREGRSAQRLAELDQGILFALAELVERRQSCGAVRPDVLPLIAAGNLFGAYFMALIAMLNGVLPDRAAAGALLRAALETQVRGLSPAGLEEP